MARYELSIVKREYIGNLEWKEKKWILFETDERDSTEMSDEMFDFLAGALGNHTQDELKHWKEEDHGGSDTQLPIRECDYSYPHKGHDISRAGVAYHCEGKLQSPKELPRFARCPICEQGFDNRKEVEAHKVATGHLAERLTRKENKGFS